MSTASSSSPVPERSVGSHADDFPLTRLRRNLFGTTDPAATLQLLKNELEKQQLYDARRWAFDFIAEKPLKNIGTRCYDWQPTVTNRSAVVEDDRHFRLIVEDSEDEDSPMENQPTQTQITDFMRKRKFSSPLQHQEQQKVKRPSQEDPGPSLTDVVRPSSA